MLTSYQLYSSRDHGALADTLAELKAIGFQRVEGYGGVLEDVAALAGLLADNGIAMPTSHMGLDALERDLAGAITIAETIGIKTIFAPYLDAPDRPTDRAGWKQLAARLEAVSARLADAGIAFGWHNHDFELVPTSDGALPLEVILEEAPSLHWQADLAWVARAGADPLEVLERYAGRVASVHVKDIAKPGTCIDEDGWADPGLGTMDWAALFKRLQAECSDIIYVAEHDKPSDAARFARQAYQFLRNAEVSS